MRPLTLEEKIEIVNLSRFNSCYGVAQEFNISHPDRPIAQSTVSRILLAFNKTGSVHRKKRNTEYALRNSNDFIEAVKAHFQENPMDSLNSAARKLEVSYKTMWIIARKKLN